MNSQTFDFESWRKRYDEHPDQAANELVQLFYDRLVRLARRRLENMPQQVADEEGAVISALRSFFSGVGDGQFQNIVDEEDLWRVLATVTARKAVRQLRVHWKQSGEGARVDRSQELIHLVTEPSQPEDETILIDLFQRCLDAVEDPDLKKISEWRLQGMETSEIAQTLGIHVRSVQRKLKLIESIWLERILTDPVD